MVVISAVMRPPGYYDSYKELPSILFYCISLSLCVGRYRGRGSLISSAPQSQRHFARGFDFICTVETAILLLVCLGWIC